MSARSNDVVEPPARSRHAGLGVFLTMRWVVAWVALLLRSGERLELMGATT